MAVKLIAVDMDGTFLNQHGDYNRPRFAQQYAELQSRGSSLWSPAATSITS
ncbi:hypothetical protein [Ewingella americana]|uniref:hypothetical protein n=1 Tax=Ewingella americana TaxID=41202 RepID=UPI0030B86A1F